MRSRLYYLKGMISHSLRAGIDYADECIVIKYLFVGMARFCFCFSIFCASYAFQIILMIKLTFDLHLTELISFVTV